MNCRWNVLIGCCEGFVKRKPYLWNFLCWTLTMVTTSLMSNFPPSSSTSHLDTPNYPIRARTRPFKALSNKTASHPLEWSLSNVGLIMQLPSWKLPPWMTFPLFILFLSFLTLMNLYVYPLYYLINSPWVYPYRPSQDSH